MRHREPLASKPVRVLYVTGQLTRGGAEQQLFYLLANSRNRAAVISLSSGGYWASRLTNIGVVVHELRRRHSLEPARLFALIRMIKRIRPELVHVFQTGTHGLYGRIAARVAGHKPILVNERHHPARYPSWYLTTWPLLASHEMVICNSQSAGEFLVRSGHVRPSRLTVIPNGVDTQMFQPKCGIPHPWPKTWKGKLVVGMVGRLAPQKNPFAFVRVAAELLRVCAGIRVVLIGDGPLRPELEKMALSLGLNETLLITGERTEIAPLLQAMDIFVLTSLHEGMPNAIMEAMACALPCVATEVGGTPELVLHGKTGFLVPPQKEKPLLDFILQLSNDRTLRLDLGRNGRDRIKAHFSLEKMASGYDQLYDSVLCPLKS